MFLFHPLYLSTQDWITKDGWQVFKHRGKVHGKYELLKSPRIALSLGLSRCPMRWKILHIFLRFFFLRVEAPWNLVEAFFPTVFYGAPWCPVERFSQCSQGFTLLPWWSIFSTGTVEKSSTVFHGCLSSRGIKTCHDNTWPDLYKSIFSSSDT